MAIVAANLLCRLFQGCHRRMLAGLVRHGGAEALEMGVQQLHAGMVRLQEPRVAGNHVTAFAGLDIHGRRQELLEVIKPHKCALTTCGRLRHAQGDTVGEKSDPHQYRQSKAKPNIRHVHQRPAHLILLRHQSLRSLTLPARRSVSLASAGFSCCRAVSSAS